MAKGFDDLRQRGVSPREAQARLNTGLSNTPALTSAASQPGAYSQTENQKLRDDIAALRTQIDALTTYIQSGM